MPAAVPVARRPDPVAPPVPPDDRPPELHGAPAPSSSSTAPATSSKTVTCTIKPGTTEIQGQPVRPTRLLGRRRSRQPPGDRPNTGLQRPADGRPVPLLHFTQADTYTIRVGAWIDYAPRRPYLGVVNTVLPDGFYGVQEGMSYKLFVSLQQHATNPDAISLAGKTITIVEGPGAGQTATIVATTRRPARTRSTRVWATAPGPGSKFQIQQSTDTLPVTRRSPTRTRSCSRTRRTSDVIVNVTPQPTPTYNSAAAFDPAANYGQNNLVQARVQTSRATFLLTGRPADGETWTILLNDRAFSVPVSAASSLDSIAEALATAIRRRRLHRRRRPTRSSSSGRRPGRRSAHRPSTPASASTTTSPAARSSRR